MNQPKTQTNQSLYQVLSLDVVLGSMAVGLFAVKLLNVEPITAWWVILPCSVWVIYTLDHLVDGFKRKGESNIYRHRIHYQYRRWLVSIAGLVGVLTFAASVFYLDYRILKGGILLSAFVLIYLALIYFTKPTRKWLQKEVFIALVYVVGIFLAPLVWFGSAPSPGIIMVMIVLIGLAAIESIMISYYDYEEDKQDDLSSFTIYFGKVFTRKFLKNGILVIAFIITLSVTVFSSELLPFYAILLLMDFALLPVVLYPEYFRKNHLFRWIGESVFILPSFIIFF